MNIETARRLEPVLIREAWQRGDLRYKLKKCQREMLDALTEYDGWKFLIKCARRLGKSYLFCLIAIMVCLRKPRARVRYAAPFKENLKEIIEPIIQEILSDCPVSLRPDFINGRWIFKNGSSINPAGVNNGNAEKLRGNWCDLFIIDEAGSVSRLRYLVTDIALPQFMDKNGAVVKGRRMLIGSSPPRTPAHEFTQMADECQAGGNYAHYDIFDGEYPKEVIDMLMKELNGPNSSAWKREALALDVVDENYAIIPEWKEEYIEAFETDEFFKFYFKYDALDIGVRDLTVCVLAHYDFKKAVLFIHDEVVINGPEMTTEKLAIKIRETEIKRFQEHEVTKRISDIDLLLINDMRQLHKLYFTQTDKGRLEEMINQVRIWVGSGKVVVHPRCKQVIGCMRFGVWNESRTEFDRSGEYGHFDALAAIMYLIRNCDSRTNPIPATHGKPMEDWYVPEEDVTEKKSALKKAFGVGGKDWAQQKK